MFDKLLGARRAAAAAALRMARRAVLGVSCAAFAGLALLPLLGLYRPVTVLSNSMEPAFAARDVIVLTKQPLREVRRGDVIAYAVPVGERHVVTHRVVRVVRGGERPVVVTKGDANSAADPWHAQLEGDGVWRHRATVPFVGHAILALRNPAVRATTLYGAPAALVLIWLIRIWGSGGTTARRAGERTA